VRDLLKSAFTSWPHCLATYVCLIGATWLLACGWKPVRVDFPVEVAAMPANAAQSKADEVGGKVWQVAFTGSMKPLLQGGEFVVTVYRYDAIRTGEVLVYRAAYHDKPIIHRAVERDSHGWLMSGDSASVSESWARVTEKNYLGTAIVAYKQK
jgi:hypothetical protein